MFKLFICSILYNKKLKYFFINTFIILFTIMKSFRYYQEEACKAISLELELRKKCLVKMFCGTGKSLLMYQCSINNECNLIVYVFPSLSLILQFYNDYLIKSGFPPNQILNISSDSEIDSTTDPSRITAFLQLSNKKIICVTYQSYETLLTNLGSNVIDVCWFDEAHHAVGETYQQLIFQPNLLKKCKKQIFLTATPKNANGIVMYDRDGDPSNNMCGSLAYDYSYYRGVQEDYLNPFEIRIDFFIENTNKSLYETISRAILSSGNGRVLTFHSDVNTERDTSVLQFVNLDAFKTAFIRVLNSEFPELMDKHKNTDIKMIALTASIPTKKRASILKSFDKTSNQDIYIISSCETIGEGIDTKNANMCVFVDPKSSYVKIIQNIGRIVRKNKGIAKPNSTILIPCWVDREKYLACEGDREKCDEVIRQDMAKEGNFNGILNVMSALKQEDEDIYDICLYYPDVFSRQEIERHLERNGFEVLDPIGDGDWMENIEYVIHQETDLKDEVIDWDNYEDVEDDENAFIQLADDLDVIIEIHTNSLETPIETYNGECNSGKIVRMLRREDEDTGDTIYQPIVQRTNVIKRLGKCPPLDAKKRTAMKVHTNPDILVLWKLNSNADLTKDICSCVIDCEVVKYDPMVVAQGIVERALKRVEEGGELLPKEWAKSKQITPELIQEAKDATKLATWKRVLEGKAKNGTKCSNEIRDYLDINLPNWRLNVSFEEKALKNAKSIVERAYQRKENNLHLIPTAIAMPKTDKEKQEFKDACLLTRWKQAMKGMKGVGFCYKSVSNYLDEHLPDWNLEIDLEENAKKSAKDIVERAYNRKEQNLHLLPKCFSNPKTEIEKQEQKDAKKLETWRGVVNGRKCSVQCYSSVINYLNEYLPTWISQYDLEEKMLKDAKEIVKRAYERKEQKLNLLPKSYKKPKNNLEKQELKDSQKIARWKMILKGTSTGKCSKELCNYLDEHLPGWNLEIDLAENALEIAKEIVKRAYERKEQKLNLLPKAIKNPKTEIENQEVKDAYKIKAWKGALKGKGTLICYESVSKYLDEHLPNWNLEMDLEENAMKNAKEIVKRAYERKENNLDLLPKYIAKPKTEIEKQEVKDACKIKAWKNAIKGKGTYKCYPELIQYLDAHLPNWREPSTDTEEPIIQSTTEPVIQSTEKPKKSTKLSIKKKSVKNPPEIRESTFKAEISVLHQRYKTLNSANLHQEFAKNPALWHQYHELAEKNDSTFDADDIPRNRIIQELNQIKTKRTKSVVDMGCGKAGIAEYFATDNRFHFMNFDHIALNEHIIQHDISNLPLAEDSVEICILSLAMWGSNCKDYIKEAHRVLETGGILYIIEPTKRWTEVDLEPGNKLKCLVTENGFQILREKTDKFCLLICLKK